MQAADDARASRLEKLASPEGDSNGATTDIGTSLADVPAFSSNAASDEQRSAAGASPTTPVSETTVCLMPHVGVQVIPPMNFGMVEDGLYRWFEHNASICCALPRVVF